MNQRLTQQRIRITYGKFGAMRFVGHLDLVTAWERILRRAQVPLEYTRGFNPRPRMQFAAALAVGLTSEHERFDAWLTSPLDDDFSTWIEQLQATSPAGLRIDDISDVPVTSDSLPQQVTSAEYIISPMDPTLETNDLQARAEHLIAQPTIERVRRKKTYDLRPLVLKLGVDGVGNLHAWVKTGEHGNARPDELVDALGLSFEQVTMHRRRLYLGDEPAKVVEF